jgi:hypothetical protein
VFDSAADIAFWIVAFIAAVLVSGLMLVGYHDQQWPISISRAISAALALSLAVLCGCSGPRIIENTPAAITVRYDPIVDSLEDATAAAMKACAAYGKIARLRQNADTRKTIVDRSAHFECVSK